MIQGKVVIIGNAKPTKDNSKFIDSCDEVVRFSMCRGVGKQTGTKTTIWVTRSYSRQSKKVQHTHKDILNKIVGQIHTAYIVYGFPEYQVGTYIKYTGKPVIDACPSHKADCIGIDMGDLVCLHPTNTPTNGLMFLWEVLRRNIFANHEVFLCGFDFTDVYYAHEPDWEKQIIDKWIQYKYFKIMC